MCSLKRQRILIDFPTLQKTYFNLLKGSNTKMLFLLIIEFENIWGGKNIERNDKKWKNFI
jgi:hypothetical protein